MTSRFDFYKLPICRNALFDNLHTKSRWVFSLGFGLPTSDCSGGLLTDQEAESLIKFIVGL